MPPDAEARYWWWRSHFRRGGFLVWRHNLLEANHGGGILMKQSTMYGRRRIFRDGGEIGGGFKILEAEFFRGAFGVLGLGLGLG